MDRRFSHPFWEQNPFFQLLKSCYTRTMDESLQLIQKSSLPKDDKEKLFFYAQQIWDNMCPVNYPWFNPLVWEETLNSQGMNWVQGFANLTGHLKEGRSLPPLADPCGVILGETLATTSGFVVMRTELFELIYYPSHQRCVSTPLLMVPSWINKFYLFDLTPETSLVKWLCGQGIPIFIISWINPLKPLGNRFAHYVKATLRAFRCVKAMFSLSPHVLGYCAGSLLITYMTAYLASQEKSSLPSSLTHLTSLFDFTLMGDLRFFMDPLINISEENVILGETIRDLFLALRPRDLIWPFVIDHYYLGKKGSTLPIFHWNDDPLNVDPYLHKDFITFFYTRNALMEKVPIPIEGINIVASNIDVPVFILGAIKDHICPWQGCYAGGQLFQGPQEFILVESGHIAGVLNPPSANKYGYFKLGRSPHASSWLKTAQHVQGSWWPHWRTWLLGYSVMTQSPPSTSCVVVDTAPGKYARTSSY